MEITIGEVYYFRLFKVYAFEHVCIILCHYDIDGGNAPYLEIHHEP